MTAQRKRSLYQISVTLLLTALLITILTLFYYISPSTQIRNLRPYDFTSLSTNFQKDYDLERMYTTLDSIAYNGDTYTPKARAEALLGLLEIDAFIIDTSTMLLHVTDLLELEKQIDDDSLKMLSQYYLSIVYVNQFDRDIGNQYLDQLLVYATEQNNIYCKALSYYTRGRLLFAMGNLPNADIQFKTAQVLFKQSTNEGWLFPYHSMMNSYYLDAIALMGKVSYNKAIAADIEALLLKYNDKSTLLNIFTEFHLASIAQVANDHALAITLFEQTIVDFNALKIAPNRNFGYRTFAYQLLAQSHYTLGNYQKASDILFGAQKSTVVEEAINASTVYNNRMRSLENQDLFLRLSNQRLGIYITSGAAFLFLGGALIIAKDYRRIKKLTKEVYTKSITDGLTGLLNRMAIIDKFEQLPRINTALALLDIDHFKRVNDLYGHQSGDEVLVEVAKLLKDHFQNRGWVGRYGGEEFLIVIDQTKLSSAYEALESIRLEIEAATWPFSTEGITVSIGLLEDLKPDFESNFKCVDALLYKAKGAGRNRIVVEAELMA